jgi:hypothetical protein
MKKIIITIILIFSFFPLFGTDINLNAIAENISEYKDKTISLKLRFKLLDRVFGKIIFYDNKNIDIEFDISKELKEQKFKSNILNLHKGMLYIVTLKVKNIGHIKEVIGELIDFEPVILGKLP